MRIEPTARDTLLKLGVERLGEFMQLAPDSVRRRFPEAARELHRMARGEAWDVAQVAENFGGGGHRAAAGAMIEGSLNEIKPKVLRATREIFT
jgi:oligoribonuclease NrnB/cAMP/cGMP phosphodiesterase (DHH superfamily)